ncbi:MAG TPA: 2Fe-2S iron-sulfur cluster-binding protein [Bacteroidales bacterium]|nr:2Fe-2S iron-sulfur cluster-binding protein [Bacteroidales bacterium]
MISLKIDNNDISVEDGTSVLEAARLTGADIPTLCHDGKLEHYTSCMVCLVKDKKSGKFIASCSARVSNGMDIDTMGEEVTRIRRKSAELLLSEHRADCEAPCRTVCPAGYNIPLMNRLISNLHFEEAAALSKKQTGSEYLWCFSCKAYCENACRRNKTDTPISIKNLQVYISGQQDIPRSDQCEKPRVRDKRFQSLSGRISEKELKEWLKESNDNHQRYSIIKNNDSASGEALACLHCDCRASSDCSLRAVAEKLEVKDPKGKLVNSEAVKKINRKTNLIFENAKCIKCGLCVRLCEESNGGPALCFMNRGFVSILSEPLTCGFEEVLPGRTRECIEICPTGALAWFQTNPKDEIKG